MIAGLFLAGMLAAIAIIDAREFRVPDRLSLPLILAGPIAALWTGGPPVMDLLIGAFVGFASLALVGELHFRLRGEEGLGLGDAKLFAAGGAWLGWQALPAILVIAALGGLAFALAARARRIAFGPWLAFGIWLVWCLGR